MLRMHYKFNPPEDVKRRQFCSMAREFGFQNATDFALVVESWTQEQRRNCLDTFYRRREVKLLEQEMAKMEAEKETEDDDDENDESTMVKTDDDDDDETVDLEKAVANEEILVLGESKPNAGVEVTRGEIAEKRAVAGAAERGEEGTHSAEPELSDTG
ncbi:hypothetical protein KEM56_006219, partial [Ascosphaera pollenicola]